MASIPRLPKLPTVTPLPGTPKSPGASVDPAKRKRLSPPTIRRNDR